MNAIAEAATPAQNDARRTESEIIESLQKTVSPSRLTLFLQCRLKFWFRYVARIPKPKSAALHVGSAAHAVLRAWNKSRWRNEPLTLKQLHDEYSKAWADQDGEPVDWEGEEEAQKAIGWRLVETYFRESKIPPTLRPEAVEVPVEADLCEHGLPTLIGVLDLVQGGGIIIDYKTSAQTPNPEQAAHTHEIQTSSYAVLYRDSTAKKEAGIEVHTLVKTKAPKLCVLSAPPMSDHQQARLFRLIEAYQHGLDVRDFVPSPGLQCLSCEYFHDCRAWC